MQHVEPIVEIRHLSKRLKDILAVDDLSLSVYPNDIYGFLGPNGSGKSTTIRLMLSLLKPDDGNIQIFGMPLSKNRKKILSKIGSFIEQANFYENLSAEKNLEILSSYSGIPVSRKNIIENLELVGLLNRAGSKVKTFSKGMKQRLGIAQALLHNPELLILDEPASGLDPAGTRDIRNLIRFLNKEKGKTIILSSHHLGEIEMIANRMVIINRGKKIVEGEVHNLIEKHQYTTTFFVDNPDKSRTILTQEGFQPEEAVVSGNTIKVQCQKKDIPEINVLFVKNGIRVESIRMDQTLEDYFLTQMQ